ncbi:DNA polymerase III subunit epsilon [Rhizobium sp. 1399]|uniref:DNA polymerase III subunit epsilon n=1 Tax=Rhizobium sp. 1399 TaxID=2817758 RepID=UPI00285F06FE|nr:DNA polymerase III subunit epsilon [Rhizobium sp. 1399]MDR6670951.1 exodeoxyribonuclease X [Rhizobium sp. 1399]
MSSLISGKESKNEEQSQLGLRFRAEETGANQALKAEMFLSCIRVIDLETAGNGPSDVCEIGWQDVVQDKDGRWEVSEERGSALVNPGRPISADTMAIHHIQDYEVASAPFWKDIAPSILRPPHPIAALAAHRAAFEQRYCTPRLAGVTPWICTWKCALRIWPELPRFSNQMLRYQRRPEGLIHEIGLPAHRAMPDAYVTAHHLRDELNAASLDELLFWSSEPGLLPRVPAGPDRGKSWDRLSMETLTAFTRDRDGDIRFSAETELLRRGEKAPTVSVPAQQTLL